MTDEEVTSVSSPLKKPSRSWYVFAAILFIVGAVGGIVILFTAVFTSLSSGVQFMVPGEVTISVDKPGKYILWNEIKTIYNGKMYSGSEELPDVIEIRATDSLTGEPIPMSPTSGSTETVGSTARHSIGSFTFDRSGKYSIEVSGDFRNRIFMLRRSVFSDIALSVVAFIVLSFIGWLIAPLIVVVVLIKRVNAERTAKGTLSTSEAPHEASSTSPSPSNDERTWATFCHLGALAIYFFPLAHLIVPLVLWLIKKDQYPFVDDQGKESLNFQISMTIYYIVSAVLMLVVIGCVLLVALGIFNLIVVIIASVKANRGERYRYPLCIRFIR